MSLTSTTPTLDALADGDRRYFLKAYLSGAKLGDKDDREAVRGYLCALDDLRLIDEPTWQNARAELNELGKVKA